MIPVFFNVLINSTLSIFCGLLVVGFFLWLFRVPTGPWRLFLLSLPFAKVVYDCLRGLPVDSVLLAGLDPFSLPPKHQLLQIGAGVTKWGPTFNVIFSVRNAEGKEFASSIGDYLAIWLNHKFGSEFLVVILSSVGAVASTLLFIRIWNAIKFEQRRRLDRHVAKQLRIERLDLRSVDVYCTTAFSGTPFTGGIINPYICIPEDSFSKLSQGEMDAVLKHEMGHIRHFDLLVTLLIKMLGDIFWFVPGYRWLSRHIDRIREIVADQSAISQGASAAELASALVKLKEIPEPNERFILYSAFFREKSLLKDRISRLLGSKIERSPRLGWQNRWVRFVFTFWIATAVLFTTIGGNHSTAELKNPEWFTNLLRALGM